MVTGNVSADAGVAVEEGDQICGDEDVIHNEKFAGVEEGG